MDIHSDKLSVPGLYRDVHIKKRKPRALYVQIDAEHHRKIKMLAAADGKSMKQWFFDLVDEFPEP